MKKALALVMAGAMALSMVACGGGSTSTSTSTATSGSTAASTGTSTASGTATEITLWTYPIGSWQKEETVNGFIAEFNKQYPDIKVNVEYLDYTNGDDKVTTAIEAKNTPDIIFEGPERLVSNWGAKGLMVDLSDLWTEEATADISQTSEAVVNACKGADGKYYEYPMCMTAHNMAINYELFEETGALQYIDQETRTWTTDNFVKALETLRDSGKVMTPAIVYCGGQGGDQGTRALVNNLYSGTYTNADHTAYTANSAENVKALELLQKLNSEKALTFDPAMQASDELQMFANGTAAMTFCWNASNEATYAEQVTFTPYAMNFPTDDGKVELCGGIWGFGIFNNGDEAKIEAAKTFIKFICDDATQGPASVQATGFFPVRSSFGNVYAGTENEERMATFQTFLPNMGDYYNVIGGWTEQRTAWWNMLQEVGNGSDVQAAADKFVETSNAAIG
ncbi:ABC transporter substrate-binding protein [Allofournierella sp. CML151]|uniref:ABC transporter substrate-binding protein n=1 Tax=Allofournierella sp. CML151 TaxID=2998082 RepID=UPI0022EA74A7|nr:ABC transporter substrate-binding protein [Fournierella sp. CML151]